VRKLTHHIAHCAPRSTLSTIQTNNRFTFRLPHRKREFLRLGSRSYLISCLGRTTIPRFIDIYISTGVTHSCTGYGSFAGDPLTDRTITSQRGTRTRSFLRMGHSSCKSNSYMPRMVRSSISSEVHALSDARHNMPADPRFRCSRMPRRGTRMCIHR